MLHSRPPIIISPTMLNLIAGLQTAESSQGIYLREDRAAQPKFLAYGQIYQKIIAYSEFFRDAGITVGTRVIFPFETREGVIIAFFALIAIGAIPLSVKPYGMGITKENYLSFLAKIDYQYDADIILEVPSIKILELDFPCLPLPSVDIQPRSEANFAPAQENDLAFVQFSSGSTSFPKGIPLTHGKIMAQVHAIAHHAKSYPEDASASWLPLYHDMGLVGAFLTTLYRKHDLHLSTAMNFLINPLGWLRELHQQEITIAVIPDFAIGYSLRRFLLTDPEEVSNLDLSKLRLVFNGSEPINIDKLHRFIEVLAPYGLKANVLKPCYGMAEAVLMVSCSALEDYPKVKTLDNGCQAICVGKPLSQFDVRVIRDDGRVCAEGEMGEIELRGGTLADRYFESEQPFYNFDGYYPTRDVGFFLNGELFVTGRISDRFVINGQSYFASDFEYALESLPFIQSGKVATIQTQEQIMVLIEAKASNLQDKAIEYQRRASDKILQQLGIKLPKDNIQFIRPRQLAKTSSGKLRRQAISQSYLDGKIVLAIAN